MSRSSRGRSALPLHTRRPSPRLPAAALRRPPGRHRGAVGEHTTATFDDPSTAEPSSLEQRRAETTAAVDEALTALRDADRSGDPDVHEAYLNAVLDHGAVLRDIADQKIERAYAEHRLDDASVSAETAAVAEELEQIESEWREAKKHTDNYLTADGASFVSDDNAAAIDHARNTYATAKQDIYRRALPRSKEINEQRAQLAKQVYYEELSRERSFGGPTRPTTSFPATSTR